MREKVILHFLYFYNTKTKKYDALNFSNKYNISINENSLLITDNLLYIPDFYGESISNLSIILGGNGSGKTTLCENIIEIIGETSGFHNSTDFAFIFSEEESLKGILSDKIIVKEGSNKITRINYKSPFDFRYSKLMPIYLTFVFNYSTDNNLTSDIGNFSNFRNLSTTYLFKRAIQLKSPLSDVENISTYQDIPFSAALEAFRASEFSKISEILMYESLFIDLGINLPKFLKIELNKTSYIDRTSVKLSNFKDNILRIEEAWNLIVSNKDLSFDTKFKLKFINRCIYSFIINFDMIVSNSITSLIFDDFQEIIKLYFEKPLNTNFILQVFQRKSINSQITDQVLGTYLKYYYNLSIKIDELLKENKLPEVFKDENFIFLNTFESATKIKELKEIYYDEKIHFKPFLFELSHEDYNSSLSSGEVHLLSIYGRLLSVQFNNLPPNIMLLIDEVDLALHPQWQKKYLKTMLNFLNNIFPKILAKRFNSQEPFIQLIITTHSPIILSDAISNSSILLSVKKNKKKSTFAANIYELFNDEFILQDGLIGDYAQAKINEIISFSETNEPISKLKLSEYLLIIQNISEPFLSYKLLEMLRGKIEDKEQYKKEKNILLNRQIKHLENLKEND